MAESPDALLHTFYPSCIVDLRIRFDETLTASGDTFPHLNKDVLFKTSNQVGPPYTGAPRLVEYGTPQAYSPLFARIPKSARVELPAYRLAGKWALTFDYRDLPIDPRTVRSLGVSIYMDTVPATEFADAMGGTVSLPAGRQGAIQQRTRRLSMLTRLDENCVMQGVADNWSVSHSSSGSVVTIEGRDLRGCLLDSPITTELLAQMPIDKNIVDIVKWLVEHHEYGAGMAVYHPPADQWPEGRIPSPSTTDGITSIATRVNKGANGKKKVGTTIDAKPDVLNYWDVVTKYCNLVGAVPYFQAEKLWIKPARNLYDQQSSGDVRHFLFGRNIEEMSLERKLAGRTPGQIEVVSLDTSAKERGLQKLLVARWPEDNAARASSGSLTSKQRELQTKRNRAIANDLPASLVSGVSPTNSAGKQDVVRLSVPGIKSIERLRLLAQEIYEEIGRGELGGHIKTRSLLSLGMGSEDPALLRLRPGHAIELGVDTRSPGRVTEIAGAPLSSDAGKSDAQMIQDIEARIGDANLARVVVATARNGITQLNNTFRVSNVNFDFDVSRGIHIEFDFHNYVIARSAVTPTPPAQPSAPGDFVVASAPGRIG